MLQDIRNSYGLTRQEVALLTKRSVNYILKAEQATFPGAPVALLDFYANDTAPEGTRLKVPWEPMDRDVMRSAYRDYQRRRRVTWLQTWEPIPYTAGQPFRLKWRRMTTSADHTGVGAFDFTSRVNVYPSSYALSAGLCIPAAVIYRNDKSLTKAGAIVVAMEDICEYVLSGAYRAEFLGEDEVWENEQYILRIAKEEGVRIPNGHTEAA